MIRLLVCACFVFAAASTHADARDAGAQKCKARQANEIAELRSGFVEAQACEAEIDDDLSNYRSCIDHLADRPNLSDHKKLGVRFQAWIMADLMARQHADFAVNMRSDQLKKMHRLQKTTGVATSDLCDAKRIACNDVLARVKAATRQ